MIQALWLIIRIIVIALVMVWLFNASEPVTFSWMDYAVKIHSGAFLGVVILTVFCIAFASRFVRDVAILPQHFRLTASTRRREKFHQNILDGLHAEEKGQTETARVSLHNAEKYQGKKPPKTDSELLEYLRRRVEDLTL